MGSNSTFQSIEIADLQLLFAMLRFRSQPRDAAAAAAAEAVGAAATAAAGHSREVFINATTSASYKYF